jgi:hypothetical protein
METNGEELEQKKKDQFRRISICSSLILMLCWIIVLRLFVFDEPCGEYYRWFNVLFGGFTFALISYYLPVGLFLGIKKIIGFVRANRWLERKKIK